MKKTAGITVKIFALSSSILFLLLAIAINTHVKIKSVNQEINALAQVIFPAVQNVDEATIAMLEQEVHFERILKLYEFTPENTEAITAEIASFEQWGGIVDAKLASADRLLLSQSDATLLLTDIKGLMAVSPLLEEIQRKHLHFQKYAFELFNKLPDKENINAIRIEEHQLELEEDELNQEIEKALEFLQAYTIQAAQKANEHQSSVLYNNVLLAVIAVFLGLIYAGILSRQIAAPLKSLTSEVNKVLSDQTLSPIAVKTGDEVGELTERFNQTLAKLRHSEKLKDLFGKYLDPRLISDIEQENESFNLNGEKQMVTVLLSQVDGLNIDDINAEPEVLVSLINDYLDIQLDSAADHKGMLNFVLTEILTFWSHPFSEKKQHNRLACEALLQQKENLPIFKKTLKAKYPQMKNVDQLSLRAGVSSGSLVVANLGPAGARSFTVIGDEVNAASRLKGVARFFDVNTIVTTTVAESVKSQFHLRPLGMVKVQGKEEAIETHELIATRDTDETPLWLTCYNRGFNYFQIRDYAAAIELFQQVLQHKSDDEVSQRFIAECALLQGQKYADNWHHEWVVTHK